MKPKAGLLLNSGVAKGGPGWARAHSNGCCEVEKDRDTLIEQSNILIKQSVGQVVPCQLTESGYATAFKCGATLRPLTFINEALRLSGSPFVASTPVTLVFFDRCSRRAVLIWPRPSILSTAIVI